MDDRGSREHGVWDHFDWDRWGRDRGVQDHGRNVPRGDEHWGRERGASEPRGHERWGREQRGYARIDVAINAGTFLLGVCMFMRGMDRLVDKVSRRCDRTIRRWEVGWNRIADSVATVSGTTADTVATVSGTTADTIVDPVNSIRRSSEAISEFIQSIRVGHEEDIRHRWFQGPVGDLLSSIRVGRPPLPTPGLGSRPASTG